jgi:hypothetical protein
LKKNVNKDDEMVKVPYQQVWDPWYMPCCVLGWLWHTQ